MAKKKSDETEALRELIIEAIHDKKGQDVICLDLRDIHDTVSDYFIITHGDSSTQVNAIFQSIMDASKQAGQRPYHSEGTKNGEWVIVDFVDVVAHIFYREKRDFYQLEELWNDAKVTKHDPAPAIKHKEERQTIKKSVPAPKKAAASKKAADAEWVEPVEPALQKRIFRRAAPAKADARKKAAAPKKAAAAKKVAAPKKAAAKKVAAAQKTTTKKK